MIWDVSLLNKKIKAVLFDLDNTLYDGGGVEGFGKRFREAFQKEKLKIRKEDPYFFNFLTTYFKVWKEVAEKYGKDENVYDGALWDLRTSILCRRLKLTSRKVDELSYKVWYDIVASIYQKVIKLSPETIPLLTFLKKRGYKSGLITEIRSDFKLKSLGIENFDFDVIVEVEKLGVAKPHSKPFLKALQEIDCKPEEALYIGNSIEKDVVGANKVGLISVLIGRNRCNVNTLKGLKKPRYCIVELNEVLNILHDS